jgi:hypothetical protein
LYNWGFIIWGLGKNSFGDWKINIWGFLQLGISKKILLGIQTFGDFKNTFGDIHLGMKKIRLGMQKNTIADLKNKLKTCSVVLLCRIFSRRLIELLNIEV